MKKIKVALFRQFGECNGYGLPEGCPKEFGDIDKRHLLADWLEQNASNDGPFIVEKAKDGSVSYEYLSARLISDDELGRDIFEDALTRLVVVEVDVSRPWMVFSVRYTYNYESPECCEDVYYLDKGNKHNQIIPDCIDIETEDGECFFDAV